MALPGTLAWNTLDPLVLAMLAKQANMKLIHPPVVAQVTPSNQQWNKNSGGAATPTVTQTQSTSMGTPTVMGGTTPGTPTTAAAQVSGGGMTGFIQQMASGMAQQAAGTQAGTPATAAPEKPKTEAELHPNGTPSGPNYKDPRLSSPSWIGGGGVYDDASHGANVAAQLSARSPRPTTPPATPKPTTPKPRGHGRWW